MSRRAPNPAAERAAQNTQTIKGLLKLEGNKTCADCKRNKRKLPWAPLTMVHVDDLQIQDGPAGIWVYSCAFAVPAYIEAWERI